MGCQRIYDLPEDLLLWILLLVPTKDAIATAILSKRNVWKMLYELVFRDEQGSESVGWLIDKSLQLLEAPRLDSLVVELRSCHVDVDVRKWVEKAVKLGVRELDFSLLWTGEPTSLPKSIYTCGTLVRLSLSNQILVHVSFPASLPSLLHLGLVNVVYKDEDSLARLLSSCPILLKLVVERPGYDNLTNFTVKVPSLKELRYTNRWREQEEEEEEEEEYPSGSLVIDTPALEDVVINDNWGDYCTFIDNMPYLNVVYINNIPNPHEKFLIFFSSSRRLSMYLSEALAPVACCNTVKFSRLMDLNFFTEKPVDWLEALILMLQNSPKLKTLRIDSMGWCEASSWNQPSTIPGCLSSHLEIVWWKQYGGSEDEKQLLPYILANSKCLKRVEIDISLIPTYNLQECQKELESIPRISPSSRLLYYTPQPNWKFS
ncbi:unnamed protein product [Thlaspi arvense]|uniref:FBD domain-containing protein n=1 Tax=Thlaspi arvense TaxID=13288 RepID=A0AAU9SNV2_THLAR|nr:unnamed protein product [Thlaspi arvense]